jgi:hypothetical protein
MNVEIRTEAAQFLSWGIHKSDFLCSVLLTLPLHSGKAAADVTAEDDISSDKAVAVVKGRFYFCQKLLQLTIILLLKKYV